MLHLHQNPSFPLHIPSSFSINNHRKSIFLSGFKFQEDNDPFEFKKRTRNGSLNAVEKDSEFEVDTDKAREALRKLDEQFQSLSKKQVNPPKIRAVDLNQSRTRENEESSEVSGSFLTFLASALLVFTIFYNVLFLTVIQPSIDEPAPVLSASMTKDAQEAAPLQEESRRAEVPFGQ